MKDTTTRINDGVTAAERRVLNNSEWLSPFLTRVQTARALVAALVRRHYAYDLTINIGVDAWNDAEKVRADVAAAETACAAVRNRTDDQVVTLALMWGWLRCFDIAGEVAELITDPATDSDHEDHAAHTARVGERREVLANLLTQFEKDLTEAHGPTGS
ncbi:hypothetical protein AB0I28_32925 [Phytomonospora sp. NPDC050363]|uniref:hypothetical protein n=1 Tax=Phytomonospora sp. NPDC050363 TaxID=3155642 RepID=UPI0033CA77EA